MTSGTMSAAGDLLAQFLTGQQAKVCLLQLRLSLSANIPMTKFLPPHAQQLLFVPRAVGLRLAG